MGIDRRLFVASLILVGTLALFLTDPCFSQGYTPSEMQQSGGPAESIEADYQYSRNIAIRKQISTSGYCAGFEIFETDSASILVVPEDNSFRFWDVSDVNAPIELGAIEDNAQTIARDVEVVAYGDSIRLFLCFVHPYDTLRRDQGLRQIPARLLDVPFTGNIETNIMNDSTYTHSKIISAGATTLEPGSDSWNIEMIYHHDGMLFVATNTDDLVYYDVSLASTATKSDLALSAPGNGTVYSIPKNHEVKGWTLSNGERLIGVGNVRTGMNILRFDDAWNYQDMKVQVYDFDRTLHPDTLINPHKAVYDSVFYYDAVNDSYLTDSRNNKWDHSICHSVIRMSMTVRSMHSRWMSTRISMAYKTKIQPG